MKFEYLVSSAVALLCLAGCGGSSGGISGTPAPPPAPTPTPTPTPTSNTTMTDLKVSQTFANESASLKGTWDRTTGTAIDGSSKRDTFSIRYDAATSSYALSTGTREETFSPSDVTAQDGFETIYRRTDGSKSETLTLAKQPYALNAAMKYVAMGFWQSSNVAGTSQSTEFSTFTYGLPTASAMMPRTGAAAYGIDVFGLVTMPGEEPRSFQGSGKFSVDFAQGVFTTQAYTEERSLTSEGGSSGGGIELRAGGSLSSSQGLFYGNAVYGSSYGQSSGSIEGRFYGPGAEELGATFNTSNDRGMAAAGSIIGLHDDSQKPDNQTLTAMMSEQLFYSRGGSVVGSLRWLNSETFDFGPPSSDMVGGRFTINEKVASKDSNFTAYAKSGDNGYGPQQVTLELYKAGPANTELEMTYASFGHWTGVRAAATQEYYFNYGFATGNNLLAARTGTARYEGVVYGTGVNSNATARYDVRGTSHFDVDFGAQTFGGALAVAGTERTSGTRADFGKFDVAGKLFAYSSSLEGTISRGGAGLGSLWAQFYGPDAQEMAGTFYFNAPAGSGEAREVGIQGAIVTRR